MRHSLTLLIFILTLISGTCFAQQTNDKIDYIAFRFEHSRRIPYNRVTIEIIKRQTETVVNVHSEPMNSEKKWLTSKIDNSLKIDPKVFVSLANEVLILNKTDLKKAFTSGLDGTECMIEFGTFGSTVTYKFWSPDYDTEKRGLTDFLRICKKMIEIGSLDPNDIL